MATTITNRASLTYAYGDRNGSAVSNLATAVIEDTLAMTKAAINSDYEPGTNIAYTISLVNNGATALNNVTVTDNLGSYTVDGNTVTPLTFTSGARLYINGEYSSELTPATANGSVTFTIASLPAGANALIVYTAVPNSYASYASGSTITNTATATATGLGQSASASAVVTANDFARVTIFKSITPATLTDGGDITYTFTLYNYGNTTATNVVLSDAFNPAPTINSVTVNGTVVPASDYTYDSGLLTLPAATSAYALDVPAATFTQNPTTGEVTATPGTVTVAVTGKLG